MRSVQRGISALFLVVAILAVTVASAAGYFVFSQNLKQKVEAINSFEECAKHYPVMESYPEQCATPDGKHFTRNISETKNPNPSAISTSEDLQGGWKLYKNPSFGIQFEHPPESFVTENQNFVTLKVPYSPKGDTTYRQVEIEKRLTQKPEDILCFDLEADLNPDGSRKYKKCEHGEDRVEEKIIAGKKARSFGWGNSQYYQIEDPLFEFRVDIILVPGRGNLFSTGERILNSIKFL